MVDFIQCFGIIFIHVYFGHWNRFRQILDFCNTFDINALFVGCHVIWAFRAIILEIIDSRFRGSDKVFGYNILFWELLNLFDSLINLEAKKAFPADYFLILAKDVFLKISKINSSISVHLKSNFFERLFA